MPTPGFMLTAALHPNRNKARAGLLNHITAWLHDRRPGDWRLYRGYLPPSSHAFFKALLFLGSGSVIHGVEHGVFHTGEHLDPQDMYNMDGLRRKMPITFWTFLIGGFALAGFPILTAGFWSKDEILAEAYFHSHWPIFITLALAALITAFYTMRQITLTFLGEPRTKAAEHARESHWTMTLPLVILAVFALAVGWLGIPEEFPLLGGCCRTWRMKLAVHFPNLRKRFPSVFGRC